MLKCGKVTLSPLEFQVLSDMALNAKNKISSSAFSKQVHGVCAVRLMDPLHWTLILVRSDISWVFIGLPCLALPNIPCTHTHHCSNCVGTDGSSRVLSPLSNPLIGPEDHVRRTDLRRRNTVMAISSYVVVSEYLPMISILTVSYTHLTLPTIYSV